MSRIVVVGGGLGGLASAARLAKLGHEVTVLEAGERLGGALGFRERDGFRWDRGPAYTLLPAVLRDLFRKSGRPLEREVELVPVDPIRQHRFGDGTVVELPSGRAAQLDAVDAGLGPGTGRAWVDYVHGFADDWEALRADLFERPFSADHSDPHTRALLGSRLTLRSLVQRRLKDRRLRELATYDVRAGGHDPRDVPAWWGLWSYVEQRFGAWTIPGGMGGLAEALGRRLDTRGVTVLTNTAALDLVLASGRVAGVRSATGVFEAEVVVVAVDPRRLPALAPLVRRTEPALPPPLCQLGLVGELPDLPAEVILHGDGAESTLTVRTGGSAPVGAHAWSVLSRGRLAEDPVVALRRAGLLGSAEVHTRIDLSPRELVEQWHGSPYGVRWQGRSTLAHRLGPRTPVPGVYAAGSHATPGSGVPAVGLSAALVAQAIGPAD